jgi:DNA-binding XRE family transcriptional regulator
MRQAEIAVTHNQFDSLHRNKHTCYMQANNPMQAGRPENGGYTPGMARKLSRPRPKLGAHLMALRVGAGYSQEDLAQLIGVQQQTIAFWEQSDKPPRSDVLIPLAQALGVTVESILSYETAPLKRNGGPKGKLQKIFEETATLPRRQQEKIAEFVSAFVNQYRQEQER